MKKKRSPVRHILRAPRKAMLLAAGFGTRMEPLSWDMPKPMMPLFGVPLLEHALRSIRAWGVKEVLINMHHAPQEILSWVKGRGKGFPLICLSFEPAILGTGGALRKAQHFIGSDPCWLVNTDIAFDLNPQPLVRLFHKQCPPAVLWLDGERGPRTVACNNSGQITNFAVDAPGLAGTYTYCGVQLFHPRLVDALPAQPFCSVIDASRKLMQEGHPSYGCVSEGAYWADLGTPSRYLRAHADAPDHLRERGEQQAAGRGLCKGSILWEGATIEKGVPLVRSISGRNVHIHTATEDSCVVRADVDKMPVAVTAVIRQLRMLPAHTLYIQLPRRGSERNFVRLADKKKSVILIRYGVKTRPENSRYSGHARFLADNGVPVPKVLVDQPDQGILVLQDAGSISLQDVKPEERDIWYPRAMRCVSRMHSIPLSNCPPLEAPFDMSLYTWEHELFMEQFLCRYRSCQIAVQKCIACELRKVAQRLHRLPQVLIHRDLQSSNILLHKNRPVLIDFQGMRSGPAVYDLASLLYDPYMSLSEEQQSRYLSVYVKGRGHPTTAQVQDMLPWAGIQRLVQALGAFGRLAADPATRRFEEHIPAAREILCRLLNETGACPSLRAWL